MIGFLFQAEEVNINNRVYHKKCLTCANCRRSLDMAILAIGPDDDIYCKGPCTYDIRLYFGDFGICLYQIHATSLPLVRFWTTTLLSLGADVICT